MSAERFEVPSLIESDKPRHECGIFGVYFPDQDVARLTFYGLYALQHRGQESAGIAVSNNLGIDVRKKMGFVREFKEEDIKSLSGNAAIGHTRYSNTGGSTLINAQPFLHENIAIAQNGNLVNPHILKERLARLDYSPSFDENSKCSSDGELIAQAIHASDGRSIIAKIQNASQDYLEGAYSLTILAEDSLIGVKDPLGLWPLCVGKINDTGYALASESCALDTIGARDIRELEAGEILVINGQGIKSHYLPQAQDGVSKRCSLDINYVLRPDSLLPTGERVLEVRKRLGMILARNHPQDADVVIGIPNSGEFGAIGYAQESGIKLEVGFIKNPYIGRTFIDPDQKIRELGVQLKLNPIPEVIEGRRIILVDDSIVRGTTSRGITELLRSLGAREVHWRSTFPQVTDPCFFGIDIPSSSKLISAGKTPEQVAQELGATSVAFNSHEDFAEASGISLDHLCTGCFTGKYPIKVPSEAGRFVLAEPF